MKRILYDLLRIILSIATLEKENEELQKKWLESEYEKSKLVSQIEKMKCCFNCDKPMKHLDCDDCHNGSNWELAPERLIRSWQDEN